MALDRPGGILMGTMTVCDLCDGRLDDNGFHVGLLDICEPCQQRPIADLVGPVLAKRQAKRDRNEQVIAERQERWARQDEERRRAAEEWDRLAQGRIEELVDEGLGVRAYNILKREGIHTIDELAEHTAQDLLGLRNFGEKCLGEVRESLAAHDRALRGDEAVVHEVPPPQEQAPCPPT
jgi:hypothetical protein